MSMLALSSYIDKRRDKIEAHVFTQESADLYMNRNICVCPNNPSLYGYYPREFKDYRPYNGKIKPDRIFWIDTDMVFKPEQFMQLVDHDVDMVSGMCPKGMDAWALGYYVTLDDGTKALSDLRSLAYDKDENLIRTLPAWVKEKGVKTKGGKTLCEVDYCGSAFVCIKPVVYERMEFPYYRTTTFEWGANVQCSEDVGFCYRAQKSGTHIFADPTCDIGHQKQIEMRIPLNG